MGKSRSRDAWDDEDEHQERLQSRREDRQNKMRGKMQMGERDEAATPTSERDVHGR